MLDIHSQPDDKSTQVGREDTKENPTDALIRMASVANLFWTSIMNLTPQLNQTVQR